MSEWQPIETAPHELEECLLWCSDVSRMTGKPMGVKQGRFMWGKPYGNGMNGDWKFSHWMPLPPPPGDA